MNLSESDFDLIQKYLADNLSDSDEIQFKVKLENEEFREAVFLNASILKNISDYRKNNLIEKLDQLNKEDDINEKSDNSSKILGEKGKWIKWISIVIILSIMAWVLYYMNNKASEPMPNFAENFISNTKLNTQFGTSDRGVIELENSETTSQIISKINTSIEEGQFVESTELFNRLEALRPLDQEEKYFYAVSILKAEGTEVEKAILLLSEVIALNSDYKAESLWFRALAYGKLNNYEKLRIDLLRLQSESQYQNENITSILNKINITN